MGIPEFEAKRYEGRVRSGGFCSASTATIRTGQGKRRRSERTGATDIASTGEAAADWQKTDKPLPCAS